MVSAKKFIYPLIQARLAKYGIDFDLKTGISRASSEAFQNVDVLADFCDQTILHEVFPVFIDAVALTIEWWFGWFTAEDVASIPRLNWIKQKLLDIFDAIPQEID